MMFGVVNISSQMLVIACEDATVHSIIEDAS